MAPRAQLRKFDVMLFVLIAFELVAFFWQSGICCIGICNMLMGFLASETVSASGDLGLMMSFTSLMHFWRASTFKLMSEPGTEVLPLENTMFW